MFGVDDMIDTNLKNEKVIKFEILKKFINQNTTNVLEFGCGAGTFLRTLLKIFKNNNFYGYDINKESIEHALKHKNKIFYTNNLKDIQKLSFNFVYAIDVLEHVEYIPDTLKEIRCMLSNNGLLLIHVPLEKSGIYKIKYCRNIKNKYSEHSNHYNYSDIKSLIEQSGFTIIEKHFHYHIISGFRDFLKYWFLCKKNIKDDKKIFFTKFWAKNIGVNTKIIKILDFISYYETKLLSKIKLFSSGVTIICKKS